MVAAPAFDPMVEGFFHDPYEHYALLREHNPVHVDGRGVVFFFRFDDVRRVLIDPRSTSMDRVRSAPPGTTRAAPPTFPLSIINRDPPDHTRLRRLLSKAFTQRNIEVLAAWMDGEVDRLLDALDAGGGAPVDLVAELTFPFPFRVISHLLGMPDGDDSQVRAWAHAISLASDPIVSKEQVAESIAAYEAIKAYVLGEVVPWKREHPADDLLSHLIGAHDLGGDQAVTTEELLDNVALLYVAGHETTTGLLGNGIANLLRNRDQLEKVQADPSLLPNAVEELNRFDSSVQFAWRYVVDELEVGDVTLAPGEMAFVSTGSANRDPGHFGDEADRLDITRRDAIDSLSFGAGMHFCLGAHLARREAVLVLGKLFERFPQAELAAEPTWGRRVTFRSPEHLPVVLA